MALMKGSSQSDLFVPPPVPASSSRGTTTAAGSSSVRLQQRERQLGLGEDYYRDEGTGHGAGFRRYEPLLQEVERVEGLDFRNNGAVETGRGGGDRSGVLSEDGVSLMDVGGGVDEDEDASAAAPQGVDFEDYMPRVMGQDGAEHEGFDQFGQVDTVLDEAGGAIDLPLATEESEREAWIAQGLETNYAIGNDGDSIFDEAIRDLMNNSSQAASGGYGDAAGEVEMDGLDDDDTQRLHTAPEAPDGMNFTIEDVEGGHEEVVGLRQDDPSGGISEFDSRGMDAAATLPDQALFVIEEERQFVQAEDERITESTLAASETPISGHIDSAESSGKYTIEDAVARDGSDRGQGARWPTTFEQELYASLPEQDAEFLLAAAEQCPDSPEVSDSEPQQNEETFLDPLENEGSSTSGHSSSSEESKDDCNARNEGTSERDDETLDGGTDAGVAGQESDEDGNVGLDDEGESERSASPPALAKDGFESNGGTREPHYTVQSTSSAGCAPTTVSEVSQGGQSERIVKQQQGNGVRQSSDARTLASSKSLDKGKAVVEPEKDGEGTPLWVKWRGKWEAAIRCSITDCPPSTLKAKPNYSKKKHVAVYFPSARLFSWVDTQHTCPIGDSPVPLLAGTHFSQREAVRDENLPRRRMLLKLGGEILDISDRLHIKAVVPFAQNVNVWKTFAKEAAAATTYSELGELLVRLHATIAVVYIKPRWTDQRYDLWKEDCAKSASAANLQKLTRELINNVRWEEVTPLWNAPEQPELDPEWEHWKGDAFDEKDSDDDSDARPGSRAPRDHSPIGAQIAVGSGSKRFKEQARARRQTQLSPDTPDTPQKRLKTNSVSPEVQFSGGPGSSSFGHATTAFRSPLVHLSPLAEGQHSFSPVQESDHRRGSVPGFTLGGYSGLEVRTAGANVSSFTKANLLDDSDDAGKVSEGPVATNSGLCTAFLKRKTRRCNRPQKEDITYCGKHKHLANPENRGKELESDGGLAWESGLCSASLGQQFSRCENPTSEGSIFCQTHIHLGTVQSADKNDGEVDLLASSSKEERCHGITTRGIQCTHKPQDASPYCAKHSAQQNEEREAQIALQGSEGSASKRARTPSDNAKINGSLVQVQVGRAGSHHGSPGTYGNGLMQKSNDENDGATRKRKCMSSFFNRRSAHNVKSPLSQVQQNNKLPNVSDGNARNLPRCKGRTTRDGEQCSFSVRPGHLLCTKHLMAAERGKKMAEEDSKISNSVSNAKGLFERFLKTAEGISSEGSNGLAAKKQLLKLTRAEASQDYSTAEELLKLVTLEMSKLEPILRPAQASVDETQSEIKPDLPALINGNVQVSHVPETTPKESSEQSTSVTCGLCGLVVGSKDGLGRHWKDSHRKDVILLVKGYACRACNSLYSRKHTVRRHWKKRHQSLPVRSPDWLAVCSTCNSRFDHHDTLLQHVCSEHPDKLSSPGLKASALENRVRSPVADEAAETLECDDCHEEFNTHWDLFHHKERIHRNLKNVIGTRAHSSGDTKSGDRDHSSSPSKTVPELFKCRNCGKKFPSLSELGRHADSEHSIPPNLPGSPPPPAGPSGKSGFSLESNRVKLQFRRKSDEKGSGSWQTAGLGPRRSKKKGRFLKQPEKNPEIAKESLLLRMKAAVQTAQLRNLRQLKRGEAPAARPRKALYSLTKGGQMLPFDGDLKSDNVPDDTELLDMAQSVCCQSKLLTTLQQKYVKLPDQMLRVSQVCSQANVKLEWLVDGYLCPGGCKEFKTAVDTAESIVCEPGLTVKVEETKVNTRDVDAIRKYESKSDKLDIKPDTKPDVKPASVIISLDLSNGQEPVAVVCSVDQDVVDSWRKTHNDGSSSSETFRPDSFNYITKRFLNPSLGLDPESFKLGCSCQGHQCSPESCEHVDFFDNDNLDALDMYGKPMKGRFPYDKQGCILLEEGYIVYECNSSCHCDQACQNRVLQKGVTVKLEVFRTLQKGWAVRAAQRIPRGTFVCEYLGEVLRDEEAQKRGERYDQVGCSYLYDIDAHLDIGRRGRRTKPFVIDATKHGNVARFINHSCAPNLINYQVLVESMDCQIAHIGLFASRDIESGEELAYDYRYRLLPGRGCPCHCGAPNCRGRLY